MGDYIYAVRPGICRLFPLGRIYYNDSFKYFLQVYECSNKNRTKVKVKKWIDTPNINEYEKYISTWHNYLMKMEKMIEEKSEDTFNRQVSMTILRDFYITPYHDGTDFYTEFYKRMENAI